MAEKQCLLAQKQQHDIANEMAALRKQHQEDVAQHNVDLDQHKADLVKAATLEAELKEEIKLHEADLEVHGETATGWEVYIIVKSQP